MKILSPVVNYELDESLLGRLNIIQGDSATGKSKILYLLKSYQEDNSGVSYVGKYPFYIAEGPNSEIIMEFISVLKGKFYIFIDETSALLKEEFSKIKEILNTTEHIVILITRRFRGLDSIPVEIDNHFVIEYHSETRTNIFVRRYPDKYNLITPTVIDQIVAEDSSSGCQFMKEYFPKIEITSSGGRGNVTNDVRTLINNYKEDSDFKTILVIVDSFAFGFLFEGLVKLRQIYPNLYTITWKCFEEYILCSPCLTTRLKLDDEYIIEQKCGELIKKVFYGYNKSYLHFCLQRCGQCFHPEKYNEEVKDMKRRPQIRCEGCDHSVEDRVAAYIHSDLQYIREPNTDDSNSTTDVSNSSDFSNIQAFGSSNCN